MAINLVKGQRVDVGLQRICVGLGWEGDADLDASAFMLGANNQVPSEAGFVFYHNLESGDKSVIHSGDLKEGGAGDVETIKVDLGKVDVGIEQIIFTVTIYDFEETGQNFGQVRNSYIRIYDADTNAEVLKYELSEDFSVETAVEFGRLYKRNGSWKFEAMGSSTPGGLAGFVKKYATAYS